ncbi:hypothetical protein [Streptomyces sp. NPDC006012]|uniref:hypothetical protein n=1 Tax=Streptomyces sp. NPDC006012 TaxID=3364739 RepID=UPI0036ADA0A0
MKLREAAKGSKWQTRNISRQLFWARAEVAQDKNLLQSVAGDVWKDYQPELQGPEKPPVGLKVALAWESLGLSGRKPVMVEVSESTGGPSSPLVPPFIADLSLELGQPGVWRILADEEKLGEQVRMAALGLHRRLKPLRGVEASGQDVVAASYARQGAGVHGQGEVQWEDTKSMFDGLDVEAVWMAEGDAWQESARRSGLYSESAAYGFLPGHEVAAVGQNPLEYPSHGVGSDPVFASGYWPDPVNPFASNMAEYDGYSHPEGTWSALPGVDPRSARTGSRVAFSPWDNPYGEGSSRVADPQLNTVGGQSLVSGATAYLPPSQPAGFGDEPPAREARVYRHRTRHTRTR